MSRIFFVALLTLALMSASVLPADAGKPRRGGGQPRKAGKKVWSGLVVATNAPRPQPAPVEVRPLDGTLRR
ncbi:MAG: hypothetical protein M3480_00730, partial [Verrucomicrobiota bacterium]|nr:hypothetical protein [Verrucomicrobiota bacterium]